MLRHNKIWKSSPSITSEHCPYCQMPFSLIKQQSLNLHLEVCLRQKSRQKSLKECPKGLKCDSTMICHYERFSHELLADIRANENNNDENSQRSSLCNLAMTSLRFENIENSSEDFVNETSVTSGKRKKLHRNCKQSSSLNRKTPLKPTMKAGNTQRKSNLDSSFKTNLSSSSNTAKIAYEKNVSEHSDSSEGENLNLNCNTSKCSLVFANMKGSLPDSRCKNSENICVDDQLLQLDDSKIKQPFLETQDVEIDFKEAQFNGISTQLFSMSSKKNETVSSISSPSRGIKNVFRNASNVKKQKQADIGTLLFGLKPLHPKVVVAEVQPTPKKDFPFSNKKQCPFYKKVDGTDIAVDAFSYGLIPGINHYFLSHFHYDHYMGLTKKFGADIYCSDITGNLVESRLGIKASQVKRLPMNTRVQVGNVSVTLLEANHCPGAVLFLLQLKNKRNILHTGDFRADSDLSANPHIKANRIDTLYLDTTYLDPNYSFPAQNDVIYYVAETIERLVTSHPPTLVVTGTYCIGKEKIFMGIAKRLNVKIFVSRDKARVLKCLDDDEMNRRITTDATLTNLHVLPMNKLNPSNLLEYLKKCEGLYDRLVAIKPTGWTFRGASTNLADLKPSVHGPVMIYGVPYSEHSSFTELKGFVELLKPNRILPTVNVGKPESRKLMESYLNSWKR